MIKKNFSEKFQIYENAPHRPAARHININAYNKLLGKTITKLFDPKQNVKHKLYVLCLVCIIKK